MRHFISVALLLSSLLLAAASPLRPDASQYLHRRFSNCSDITTGVTPACWDTLNMTAYINKWWTDNGQYCQSGNIPFATCFQQYANISGQDCTINANNVCTPPAYKGLSVQDYYVVWNIYAINQYFNNYWTALGNANTLASESVGNIVLLLNPPKKVNIFLRDLLTALGAAFVFLRVPSNVGQEIQSIGHAIVEATKVAPWVAKVLLPTGTLDSQVTQMANLQQSLGSIINTFQQSVSSTIPAINGNFTAFSAFAATGAFCAGPKDLQIESNSILTSLYTYVISECLKANNVVVTSASPWNGCSPTDTDVIAKNPMDADGICGAMWWESQTNTTYSLNKWDDMGKSYHSEMKTIFANWTTPQALFDGAKTCNGGNTTISESGGQLMPQCMSTARWCDYNMNCFGTDCEFNNCETQGSFGVTDCPGYDTKVKLPQGYGGQYLEVLGAYSNC